MYKKNILTTFLCLIIGSGVVFGQVNGTKIQAILNGNTIIYNGDTYVKVPQITANITAKNINDSTLTILNGIKVIKEKNSLNTYLLINFEFKNNEFKDSRLYDAFYISYYQNDNKLDMVSGSKFIENANSEITLTKHNTSLDIPIVVKSNNSDPVTIIINDSITYQEISRFTVKLNN